MKSFFTLLVATCLSLLASAQVKFKSEYQRLNDKEVLLTIRASVDKGGKLYSVNKTSEDGLYSSVTFDSSVALNGKLEEKGALTTEKDTSVGVDVTFASDSLVWQQ